MRWHDAAVVAATAAATALVVLAIGWTGLAVATEGQPPEVKWPVLREGGCEITLQADQAAYKAGDSPVVKLVAANPGQSPVSLEATLRMMVRPPVSELSRIGPIARRSWEHKCTIALEAGEKKTLSIPTEVKAAGNTSVFFTLQIGKASVSTRPLVVAGPAGRGGELANTLQTLIRQQDKKATQ
ncbi:MAG TPA: hypothetical protein VNE39_05075 [Planctomycetota bacterium]|nr:hypothetical protein [Planctomycetota bacterium]